MVSADIDVQVVEEIIELQHKQNIERILSVRQVWNHCHSDLKVINLKPLLPIVMDGLCRAFNLFSVDLQFPYPDIPERYGIAVVLQKDGFAEVVGFVFRQADIFRRAF